MSSLHKKQANEVRITVVSDAPVVHFPYMTTPRTPLTSQLFISLAAGVQVRAGNMLEVEGKLMHVIKAAHTQGSGRQLGNVQLELRDAISRSKHPLRLRPGDPVTVVHLEDKKFQFLYHEGENMHLMDPRSFEQVAIDRHVLGEQATAYLCEGGEVLLSFHEGIAVSATLPAAVTLKVMEAAPHVKGETAAPQYKPAVLETGATVSVPPFVNSGDSITVDTATGNFVKRVATTG